MTRRLTSTELDGIRDALLSPEGQVARQAIFEMNLGRPASDPDGFAAARKLGLLDDDDNLTELGALLRDPIRELSLWIERDGAMGSADVVSALGRESYANKRVLELGSGSGCNLLSLQHLPGRFVGLEPVVPYVQLMPVVAAIAGVPTPEGVAGFAEAIPFADASFDIVLCYTSHQYMDIDRALAEMARVLDHRGRIVIVGNSLGPFSRESVARFWQRRHLGTLKYDLTAIANTVGYQVFGRRMVRGRTTTASPVYPSHRHMRRRLGDLGLGVDTALTASLPTGETALFATRR